MEYNEEEVNNMYISEVTKYLDMSKKAIEVYEEKGFIHPSKDTNGYRVYAEVDLKALKQIQILRKLDFSLAQIEQIVCFHHYEVFDLKMENLKQEERLIQTKIQYYDKVRNHFEDIKALEAVKEDLLSTFAIMEKSEAELLKKDIQIPFQKISYGVVAFIMLIQLAYVFGLLKSDVFSNLLFYSLCLFGLLNMKRVQVWITQFICSIKQGGKDETNFK